jgi:tripartite-type tricarboxylate transporter receptor subunit TctC
MSCAGPRKAAASGIEPALTANASGGDGMKTTRKVAGLFLALSLALACGESAAQSYPSRPIRLVVGFVPGGGTDVTARMIGPKLSEQLGQPVVVENRPGAEARIATEYVAKAAPDGYTLLAGASGQMVFNPGLFAPLPYDPVKDFIPITLFNADPLVFAVHPSVPAYTLKELVALAKTRPGQVFHASSASAFQVAVELFKKQMGVDIVHVPYKGAAPAVNAAVAGETSLILISIPPIIGQLQAGKLRALAINGRERSRFLPDVPTALESGMDFEGITWAGLFAPAGTPRAIIDRLYGAMSIVLKDNPMKERFVSQGREPIGGVGMTPAEFDVFFKTELAKWTKVIKDLNIRAD